MMDELTILGGGFSGMCAAIALADQFKVINIIDRSWESSPNRTTMPQSDHLHVLMAAGQNYLQQLVPQVWQDLLRHHPIQLDWGAQTFWHTPYGTLQQNQLDVETLMFSRLLLNQLLLKHLKLVSNIKCIQARIQHVTISKGRVDTISLANNNNLTCNGLVLDTRGRATQLQKNLAYLNPIQIQVDNSYQYFSRKLEPGEFKINPPLKQIYIQPNFTDRPYGLVLSPIEHGYAIITVIYIDKNLSQDISPEMVIQQCLAEHPVAKISVKEANWHKYAQLSNRKLIWPFNQTPTNLRIVGDALCVTNPVYGQGMSTALKQIFYLKHELIHGNKLCSQRKIYRYTVLPWLMATSEDQRHIKQRTLRTRIFNALFASLIKLAIKFSTVHRFFIRILHQIHPICCSYKNNSA